MHVMDDTFTDESALGIPFLSSTEDIPVHSTPIKGSKVPLPSTKDVMKHLLSKPERQDDFTDGESVQSIRNSDLHPRVKGQHSAQKDQGQNGRLVQEQNYIETKKDKYKNNVKHFGRHIQDLSNIDNLRQKGRNPVDEVYRLEGSRSPKQDRRRTISQQADVFKRPKDVQSKQLFSVEDEKRILMGQSENDERTKDYRNGPEEQKKLKDNEISRENTDSNAFSSHVNSSKYLPNERQTKSIEVSDSGLGHGDHEYQYKSSRNKENSDMAETARQASMKVDAAARVGEELRESSKERKRFSINSPRNSSNYIASHSRIMSSSKQNTSLSELENTTLHKQRQEIQLLMAELKDRDRELSDMMKSHQQQLVAWQQDRERLVSLERKCMQFEEAQRMKASQLRSAVINLKSMKSAESEHKKDVEKLKSTIDRFTLENNQLKEELSQLQSVREGLNESLQENVKGMSNKIGRIEAREEELTTSLRLKEKDISSATSHMKELSERLQQLDLKCKEAQDREREALKGKQDWKQKFESSTDEFNALTADMDYRRKEVVRLAEENNSARQQLSLIQKEASMMERCKDELIDSMRVKQERTDTQLCNLRELYDRQVKLIASLQMQYDNSRELLYRQQNSIEEQQLSSSYQGRLSQASEYSPERSSGSQRLSRSKFSPTQSTKYREPDMTGSHQQTQSSGYQSQLYENHTGNQPVPNTSENNNIDLTGSRQSSGPYQSYNSEKSLQPSKKENQSVSKHINSHKFMESSDIGQALDPDSESNVNKVSSEVKDLDSRATAGEFVIQKHPTVSSDIDTAAKVCQTPPKAQIKPVYDSPQRQDGYVIQKTTIELTTDIDPQKPSMYCGLNENVSESREKAENALFERDMPKIPGRSVSGSNKGAIVDSEHVLRDSFLATNKDEKNLIGGLEAYCDIEFEKKYTFENKLCSFLEDIEDIDDSIWDEKPKTAANVSTTDSSPASKLRKLLIESQQMIQSLEMPAESPRQVKNKESRDQNDRESQV